MLKFKLDYNTKCTQIDDVPLTVNKKLAKKNDSSTLTQNILLYIYKGNNNIIFNENKF